MKSSAGTFAVKRRNRFDIWDVMIHLVLIVASLACTLPFITCRRQIL